jgi:two-component system, OmpR family, response regulator BaeR
MSQPAATDALNPLILIVEDEPKIAAALADYLRAADFRSHTIADGSRVLPWLESHQASLVILDVMLPGMDGFALAPQIQAKTGLPILFATARVEESDRLEGFALGADDYLCKPYSLKELVARVRAVLARSARFASAEPGIKFQFLPEQFEVIANERTQTLTRVETRLLQKLSEHPSRVWSRQQLMPALYDDHRVVDLRTVDSHIRNLRKKLAELGVDAIESVYGEGFRLR